MEGVGVNFFSKKSLYHFGNYDNPGGSQFFKNVPISIILQYYLYKKCLKIKNVWIWYKGGQQFSKMSETQKKNHLTRAVKCPKHCILLGKVYNKGSLSLKHSTLHSSCPMSFLFKICKFNIYGQLHFINLK